MVLQHIVRSWRNRYLENLCRTLMSGETIGYIGRVGSAYDVTLNNYFIMQICCLIISPAFFSAALYLTIGNL
jgi:RTA1 like protein